MQSTKSMSVRFPHSLIDFDRRLRFAAFTMSMATNNTFEDKKSLNDSENNSCLAGKIKIFKNVNGDDSLD